MMRKKDAIISYPLLKRFEIFIHQTDEEQLIILTAASETLAFARILVAFLIFAATDTELSEEPIVFFARGSIKMIKFISRQ